MKKSVLQILVISASLLSSLPTLAVTIYCSPNGNDQTGTGSLSLPYRNVEYAIGQANPGDVIELRQGSYASDEIRISINNLTIRSYPGEWASIVAPLNDIDASSCIWYDEPDINGGLLENLEIVGGYYYGIKLESNWDWGVAPNQRHGVKNIRIKGCNIHHTGRDCIKLTPGCENINIESCEIHHSGVGPSNDPNDPNAEGIDNVNSNMWVHNCYFHDISTTGLYAKGGAKDCIIEENLLLNTGEGGILIGFYTDEEWFDEVNNPDYYESIRTIVRNNMIVGTGGAGIGFFGAKDCQAYNNTVITASPKFHSPLFFNTGEIWIDGNTVKTPANLNVQVWNNIFVDQSSTDEEDLTVEVRENALTGSSQVNHNLYYKTTGAASFRYEGIWPNYTFADWQTNLGFDAMGLENNPQLDAQHHLTSGSICIDAGLSLSANTRDYDGAGRTGTPDIGADEWGNTALTCPPPASTVGTGATPLNVGIEMSKLDLQLYPNPSADVLVVQSSENLAELPLEIWNIKGQKVTPTLSYEQGSVRISCKELENGLYILTIGKYSRSFLVHR